MSKLTFSPIFLLVGLLAWIAISSEATGLDDRIDCRIFDHGMSKEECHKRGCRWDVASRERVPWCYFDDVPGYKVDEGSSDSSVKLSLKDGNNHEVNCQRLSKLEVSIKKMTKKILRIKITDPVRQRYEVPIQQQFNSPRSIDDQYGYDVKVDKTNATIVVTRKDNQARIIDTSIGGLIFCDQFLQFATYLPKDADFYGFGENYRTSFKHDLQYRTLPMFARDRHVGDENGNTYGHHPFMMGVQEDGKAFGIFMLNSNAMAYTFMPAPALSLKMAGGIMDMFIFIGDSPEEVVSLYTSIIGTPIMPPFWALGYQNCRWGYKNLDELNKTIERNLRHRVPLDVQYMDIDYMEKRRDFTYSQENFEQLPQLMQETKDKYSLRWTLILDPAIEANHQEYRPFTEGYANDVFIKWPAEVAEKIKYPAGVPTDKNVLYGKVWPDGPAAFPDFFKESTKKWWKEMIGELYKKLPFDALWIDMNEPANFDDSVHEYTCPDKGLDFKREPMKFNEPLNRKTICMDAIQGENGEYRHYDVHSLYGWSESQPTLDGLRMATKKRGFVVSRSTYPSSGKYVAHWLGDNASLWEHLRQSIIGMMEFSLFGFAFTGADICGFNGAATPDMCRRWFQLGAYYPFSRSHNTIHQPEQDAGWWADNGHPEVTKAAVEALRVRYQFLHYMYTAFYDANRNGATVVRPMHHVFVKDQNSRSVDQQFFLGSSLLVTPFLWPNQSVVNAYLPAVETNWYKLAGDFVQKVTPISEHYPLQESESSRPLFLRGGSIIPVVAVGDLPEPLNTENLRRAPISLWVLPGFEGKATGELFYDDGESIDTFEKMYYAQFDFTFENCRLTIKAKHIGMVSLETQRLRVKEILLPLGDALTDIRSDNIRVTYGSADKIIPASVDSNNNIRIRFEKPLDLLDEFNSNQFIEKLVIANKDHAKGACFIR